MSALDRIRRQQQLSEAEGYLDLIMVLSDQWPLGASVRDRVALRALQVLDEWRPTDAHLGHAMYLQGQAWRAMERYSEAIPLLESAADDDPGNFHIWLALGWCFKRVGRLDLAIESLEEAVTSDPSQAIVHYNLACYWSLAGNVESAVRHLEQAFQIDTNYRDLVAAESDFDPIRSHGDFQSLTSVIV